MSPQLQVEDGNSGSHHASGVMYCLQNTYKKEKSKNQRNTRRKAKESSFKQG
jgi:hypothetical protein